MQFRGRKRLAMVGGAVVAALAIAACGSSSPATTTPGAAATPTTTATGTINGSGSTFQLTFQQTAISAFKSVDPGIKVNYSGVGSGTGRSNLAAGTVNFAGSDSTIPSTEQSSFHGTVLYFPILMGPIAMAYNLPGISTLKLTPKVIAEIFQGQIKTWNAPAIKDLNAGVNLPSTAITTAVRSDSSGTTQNFTLFLTEAAATTWTLGTNSTIKWPSTARAASGNGGVASVVKSTPGAIGYVDFTDAKASGLSMAEVQNKDGAYVAPSVSAASVAGDGVSVASNLTFHAVWASGATAYPITYQTWVLVFEKQPNANDADMLKAYLGYLLGAGQQLLPTLYYAPLPASISTKAVAQLSKITG
jgi:phosphate transport system substrate-binding protein